MPKPNCKCAICDTEIYRIPSKLNGHNLCSYACRNKYFSGDKSFVWKGGERDKKRDRSTEKARRIKYKDQAVQYLGGKCKICGYDKCNAALDFHHIDPLTKDKTIKDLIAGSWNKIQKELDKCELLCSNCHREFHWNLNNNKEEEENE